MSLNPRIIEILKKEKVDDDMYNFLVDVLLYISEKNEMQSTTSKRFVRSKVELYVGEEGK